MLATLSSKGQITLPKEIRDRLGLTPGSRLDFEIADDGTLIARPVATTALGLSGLLRCPGGTTVSVEDMNETVEQEALEQFGHN